MSTYKQVDQTEITSTDQLLESLRPSSPSPGRMGIEWELLPCDRAGRLVSYYAPGGISDIFAAMSGMGYEPQFEKDMPVGLNAPRGQFIGLEPGGQIEISTPPRGSLAELRDDLDAPLAALTDLSARSGWAPEAWGIAPANNPEDLPDVPKERYSILADHLRSSGRLGRWMMKLTAATQYSIDPQDRDSASAQVSGALRLLPCLVGWLANSPTSLRSAGVLKSQRPNIWRETDPGRCGLPPFFFGGGDLFGGLLDYLLTREVLFFVRGDSWLRGGGKTFEGWLKDPGPMRPITMDDWILHNSSIFTDLRFRGYIEIRTPDSVPLSIAIAAGALCKGLLSEPGRLADWAALLPDPDPVSTPTALLEAAGKGGLWSGDGGHLAGKLFSAAKSGLVSLGEDPGFLEPLERLAGASRCPADLWVSAADGSARGPSASWGSRGDDNDATA